MKKNAKATEASVALIDEQQLKNKIYTIRGVKVMLDADLAEIYGYSTKAFNQQVKNNIGKFPGDFHFQLNDEETRFCSRSKILTLNSTSRGQNIKYRPFAFTEQGIYMLMTVLKGDLATQQSIALIRLFKQMKDYIIAENHLLPNCANCTQIAELRADVRTLSNKAESLQQKSQEHENTLTKIMDNFVDPSAFKHFLILNGQKLEADLAYTQIYGMAKASILIVDNYVGVKTLDLLRGVAKNVKVTILGDQRGSGTLTPQIVADFKSARPDVDFSMRDANNKFHDRYILLDSGLLTEKLFHCGASSKDAGGKITTIMEIENAGMYHNVF